MPPELPRPEIDVNAVAAQLDATKRHRNAAMDELSFVYGNLEGLKVKFKELQDKYDQLVKSIPNKPEDQGVDNKGISREADKV